MIKINDVVKKANEAGYKTYLKRVIEPYKTLCGMTERKYVLDGHSWDGEWMLPESEIEKEYNVFCRIIKEKEGAK